MTDGGTAFQPGAGETPAPFRPRSGYAGHEAFGQGDGAVLIEPRVARELRLAAESATLEGRIAGGLLYGRHFADEQGSYLAINGFLEAGPGENRGDRISRDRHDEFTLSAADLRLLRNDAARMYTSSAEAGWWRSLPAAGEFGPRDFQTQYELVGPGGVGLLVFGAGLNWGAAYLGPDALPPGADELAPPARRLAPETLAGLRAAPDFGPYADGEPSADLEPSTVLEPTAVLEPTVVLEPTAVLMPEPAPAGDGLGLADGPDFGGDTDLDDEPDLVDEPVTEPLAAAAPASALVTRRQPVLTPAPQPTGSRAISPVRVPEREWGVKPHNPGYVGPEVPTDVKIVVAGLCLVVVAASVMIGMLVSDALAAVVVGVVGFLVIAAFLWFARL
jgi:hypothetical protein